MVSVLLCPGVAEGQVLRVKGQGHMGKQGGAPGDLLVRLQVTPPP
jgi:DnaJ-class molecular chaperone